MLYIMPNYTTIDLVWEEFEVPKGYSESGNRRTDNTMAKRKNNVQNTKQKTKDRATRTQLELGVISGAPEG